VNRNGHPIHPLDAELADITRTFGVHARCDITVEDGWYVVVVRVQRDPGHVNVQGWDKVDTRYVAA
jgi:hypothetical protein